MSDLKTLRWASLIIFFLMSACGENASENDASIKDDDKIEEVSCADKEDGFPCGAAQICLNEECVASECGDGFLDTSSGEQCDDGNSVQGDGCELDCRFSCQENTDCQDGNFCNGEERCIDAGFGKLCVPAAMPLNCDEGAACTVYSCDPNAETLDAACTSEEISLDDARCWRDADGDGHPSFDVDPDCDPSDDPFCENGLELISNEESSCGCPEGYIPAVEGETAADCDDEDALTYPGAPQICGNTEKNDCEARNGSAPPGMGLTYYCARDNDRDGYPDLDRHGNLSIEQGEDCVCPEGLRYINYTNIDKGDCDGTNKDVNPGITKYSDTPYCPGEGRLAAWNETSSQFRCPKGVTPSFDFNCDGDIETWPNYPTNFDSCPSDPSECPPKGAIGWIGDGPDCGEKGELRSCEPDKRSGRCNEVGVGPSRNPLSCR